ncbi:MAG: Cof-type HAD-IIB family hydrolase [Streptococcaceae bacterium]|nr:Cof-type HAD-IIB family hydrolase [Streptococcaceae bacterium]
MMKNIKAVCFFDLDGTLLNEKSVLGVDTIQALSQLKANGVLPVIATGRSMKEVKHLVEAGKIDAFLTLNGQYIEVSGEKVYESVFSPEEVEAFIQFVQENRYGVALYNAFEFWGYALTDEMVHAYAVIHAPTPPISQTKHLEKNIHMLLALTETPDRDVEFYQAFPSFNYFRNSPSSIDITKDGNDKGVGVKRLLEKLNLVDVPTYAFGDGRNDLALLKAVNHPIAMENAIPELKDVAEFVTKSNADGGIVFALQHFGLI